MAHPRYIVGLGNPGSQYSETRHNIGFMAVDRFVSAARESWRSGDGCDWCEVVVEGKKVFFLKPLTYMNRSGEPLQRFLSYRKGTPAEVLVIHDEVDLELGVLRLKNGGGEGGHNGLRSISQMLNTTEYPRLRLGVGRPLHPSMDTADWVLGRFGLEERKVVDEMLESTVQIVRETLEKEFKLVQNKVNTRVKGVTK